MTMSVKDILALIKTGAAAGSEAQTQGSGQAAMAHNTGEQAQQQALGGADMSANTAQKMGEGVADVREALKDKVMRATGSDLKAKEEGDPEAKVNMTQDSDAARTQIIDAGGDPQPPPGAVERPVMKTASDYLTAMFDDMKKSASDESASEVVKVAEDAEAWGRWAARGFCDELFTILGSEEQNPPAE
jgi:hypothetical protein